MEGGCWDLVTFFWWLAQCSFHLFAWLYVLTSSFSTWWWIRSVFFFVSTNIKTFGTDGGGKEGVTIVIDSPSWKKERKKERTSWLKISIAQCPYSTWKRNIWKNVVLQRNSVLVNEHFPLALHSWNPHFCSFFFLALAWHGMKLCASKKRRSTG